ncbi:uncharacterized protein LOC123556348 [Mercenaria mercenaria]|uniref:uncharacterized protein LOC123556348 n=1 Tax=Mercenaria mercenaria TaxID=6596 RepID=UPI00234E4749|nr:uncharacterized protein LOC123556348 [Mercenaria mercenaria]
MRTKMLHVSLVIFGFIQFSESFQSSRQDSIVTANGTYKLDIKEFDTEEDIEVMDSNGTRVIEVDIFTKGYVVDKPENDTTCYLSEDVKSDQDDFCYTYVDMPKKNLTDDILKKCEGRDIVLLISKADGCEKGEENESTTAPARESDEGNKRVKRAICVRTYYWTVRRVYVRYCCRRLFGVCVRSCYYYQLRYVRFTIRRCF